MKSYTITVNGNVYDVTVEENVGGAVAAPVRKAAPVAAPKVAPEDGTIASIDVAVGDAVEAGGVLATLN